MVPPRGTECSAEGGVALSPAFYTGVSLAVMAMLVATACAVRAPTASTIPARTCFLKPRSGSLTAPLSAVGNLSALWGVAVSLVGWC